MKKSKRKGCQLRENIFIVKISSEKLATFIIIRVLPDLFILEINKIFFLEFFLRK